MCAAVAVRTAVSVHNVAWPWPRSLRQVYSRSSEILLSMRLVCCSMRPARSRLSSSTAKLGVTVSSAQVRSNGAQLAELRRLLDAGTVRVAIDSTFGLADARAAHGRAARGHIQGKIVLTVA
ncbi:zinc-binding dehydrogenase [Streptomyces sp. NPDC020681]|uniref:zinc-binding dehydrogenase n=1 Tax=Streptomyces sp. NPDC020681 TaxID=3365083 RepID=UPI0037ADF107